MENTCWISTKERMPRTGEPVHIVWADTVQMAAYHRVGIGFACSDGYEWRAVGEDEFDPIPDNEVQAWMTWPKYER